MEDLNTSDHLPLTVSIAYDATLGNNGSDLPSSKKIDWAKAEKTGALKVFSTAIRARLEPLLTRVYDNAEDISREIKQVATLLKDTAEGLLHCMHNGINGRMMS